MTVSSSASRNQATGNGVTTVFPYTFKILDQTHLSVVRTDFTDPDNPVDTTLILSTNYSVQGVGASAGGSITAVVAPTANQRITITRNVPFDQQSAYEETGKLPAATLEANLDKLTMIVQQMQEALDRSLTVLATAVLSGIDFTVPAPEASSLLGWNAAGTGLENYDSSESSVAAAVAAAIAAAASAAAALVSAGITRDARSSNTILAAADNRKLIYCTGAGWTQTLVACATLGSSWNLWIYNGCTADVIIDPNGAETIDGAATLNLRPGDLVQLQCNGTNLVTAEYRRSLGFTALFSQIMN